MPALKPNLRLRWKMEDKETGRSFWAGPRAHWLTDGEKKYAWVSPLARSSVQWYWVAGWDSGVPHRNTVDEPQSLAEAKASAMTYVRAAIAQVSRSYGRPFCSLCGGDFGKHETTCPKSKVSAT